MDIPEPRTISPALWERRDIVFNWLEKDWHKLGPGLNLVELKPLSISDWTSIPTPETSMYHYIHLMARRAHGPAPWTERPYHYEWKVATGPSGYWAASDCVPVDPYGMELHPW